MSTTAKKPPATSTTPGRRPSTDPTASPSPARGPARSPTPSSSTPNGAVARTRSIRGSGTPLSARSSMQRNPTSSNLSTASTVSDADDDARAETVVALDELKERLRGAEIKADQAEKQNEILQLRLDEAVSEQGKLEDRLHEGEERLESLENEKRDALRKKREMESIYEGERGAMLRERDEAANREEEMQAVIQRLKESLNQRPIDEERRMSRHSNNSSPNIDSGHFAPPNALNRSDSRNNSKIVLQKDRLIEALRLELAEAQIKLVESENSGGGRLREVERLLMDTKVANAKLVEENESYQSLLFEKTLNGELVKHEFGFVGSNTDALDALEGRTAASSSLADELEEAGEGECAHCRKLETEVKAVKDQNRGLTLYINKIIERLLQHSDFEAILDQSDDFKPSKANTEKDLPPPPPAPASGTSILQRAKSVAMGNGRPRPRPMSQMPAAHSALTDPDTAPSIPFGLGRSQSVQRKARPQSEQFTGGPATVVNQMYKGNAQISPPLHGPQTPRNSTSFFSPPAALGTNPNAASRNPSSSQPPPTTATFPGGKSSERSSIDSGDSTPPSTSPPRAEKATTFAGNKPRPLRLVQDAKEEDAQKNKRASWMGWAMNAVGTVGKKDEISTLPIRE